MTKQIEILKGLLKDIPDVVKPADRTADFSAGLGGLQHAIEKFESHLTAPATIAARAKLVDAPVEKLTTPAAGTAGK